LFQFETRELYPLLLRMQYASQQRFLQ